MLVARIVFLSDRKVMRSIALVLFCSLLAVVYWFGIEVYSERIEEDISARTQQELESHRDQIPAVARLVDGRDVTITGVTASEDARVAAGDDTLNVWGVRVLDNQITRLEPEAEPQPISEPPPSFNLHADHLFPNLSITGLVGQPAYDKVAGIHQALPPESIISYSGLQSGGPELSGSPRIIETGIAAVTQLNPGTLLITDEQFILEGVVNSIDRKRTVEQLIDVRRSDIEPLEISVNITVDAPGLTLACQEAMSYVLSDNVLNYAVDHYRVLSEHESILSGMANTILGVCQGQIESVLVEGHADYTGGAGYNQGLSERRSGTVRENMIGLGVPPELINAFGYGEFRPIASNQTIEGRARNRRTEIYLLTQDQMSENAVPQISLGTE